MGFFGPFIILENFSIYYFRNRIINCPKKPIPKNMLNRDILIHLFSFLPNEENLIIRKIFDLDVPIEYCYTELDECCYNSFNIDTLIDDCYLYINAKRIIAYEDLTIEYVEYLLDNFPNVTGFYGDILDIENKKIPDCILRLTYLRCSDAQIIPECLINLKYLIVHRYLLYVPNTLTNLVYLECRETEIPEIPNTLVNLEYLDCSYTNITGIPNTLTKLKYLICSDNNINILPDTLTALETLCIQNTNITTIPDTFINLKDLDCSINNIYNLPNTFVNLDKLDYCGTNITTIPNTYKKTLVCSKYTDV